MGDAENIVTAPTPEAAAPEAPTTDPAPSAEPKKDPPTNFTVLARKEKELVRRQKEFSERQAQWEAQQSEWKKAQEAREAEEALFKKDPFKLLEKYGYSYAGLTEQMIQGQELTPEKVQEMTRKELEAFQKKQEEERKAADEAKKKEIEEQNQKAVEEYRGKLKGFVEEKKDDFPLTHLLDADAELIYQTVEAYFEQHRKVLSNEEAGKLVEQYFDGVLEKAIAAKKAKEAKLAPPPPAAPQPEKKPEPAKPGARTLTNSLGASNPALTPAKATGDRYARALAAMEGRQ